MPLVQSATAPKPFGYLQLITLALSIYVLLMLAIGTLFDLPPEIARILQLIDHIACGFFLLEFLVGLYCAPNRWVFLRWVWLDLLASIPMVESLRAMRIIRVIRLLRVLKSFRSIMHFTNHLFQDRAKGTFISVALIALLLIMCSSIAILQVEVDPLSNIKTAEDALWWSYVTMTTVGYGDKFPVTLEGRLIAVGLMTAGVGLFGVFSGFVASWFVKGREQPAA